MERKPCPQEMTIDLTQIPDIRREDLFEAMTAPLTAFFAQPENQAKFEKWLKKRNCNADV